MMECNAAGTFMYVRFLLSRGDVYQDTGQKIAFLRDSQHVILLQTGMKKMFLWPLANWLSGELKLSPPELTLVN